MPLDLDVLGGECGGEPLPSPIPSPAPTLPLWDQDPQPKTLIVTQQERFEEIYGAAAWNAVLNDPDTGLIALAQHPTVAADIISLPSTIYYEWDSSPCDVDKANDVTAAIRSEIFAYLDSHPSIQYIVLAGGDDVIPHHRVPDETTISNESLYLPDAFLQPGPLFASISGGYNLTDDYYVDFVPSLWQGRELYIPDMPTGRLIETPDEIMAAAGAFLDSNGVLDLSTAFASGYDFFDDGAQAMADALGTTTDTLITPPDPDWNADDLRCELLGEGDPLQCAAHDVSALNAHMTHYAALSAFGFANDDFNDIMTSSDVADADAAGRIVFSMGCHSGLNVPDDSSLPVDPGLGIDPATDFPQAMARQQAVYVANTGFGVGEEPGVLFTELLLATFAGELVEPNAFVGDAFITAKQLYLTGQLAMTEYDEKVSIQSTLFGLPMYQVDPPTQAVVAAVESLQAQTAGIYFGDLTLTVDGVPLDPIALEEVISDDGSYITADGDVQVTAGRPIQPRVVQEINNGALDPVHGVVLTGGSFTDLLPFDPLISRPDREWQSGRPELQICIPGDWPSVLAIVNSLDTGGALLQNLVVTPAQFRCTSGPGDPVLGRERIWTELGLGLLRSSSDDFQPPLVSSVSLSQIDDTTVAVNVEASDDFSGISQIIVLLIARDGSSGTVTSIASGPLSGPGPFTVEVPDFPADADLVLQVIDGANNPATLTAKAAGGFSLISVDAGPDKVFTPGLPVQLTATVSEFTDLTPPISFQWDFGDGTFDSGLLAPEEARTVDVTVDGAGNATFTVEHIYAAGTPSLLTATLKVTDADGGVGLDDVSLMLRCDPTDALSADADLIGCHVDNDATTVTVAMRVEGTISNDSQYRVLMDVGTFDNKTKTFRDPLDGNPDFLLKYDGGSATGLVSLSAEVEGSELRFSFDLAEIGRTSGDHIQWFGESQAGVPSEPETGKLDNMPDTGFLGYVLR